MVPSVGVVNRNSVVNYTLFFPRACYIPVHLSSLYFTILTVLGKEWKRDPQIMKIKVRYFFSSRCYHFLGRENMFRRPQIVSRLVFSTKFHAW